MNAQGTSQGEGEFRAPRPVEPGPRNITQQQQQQQQQQDTARRRNSVDNVGSATPDWRARSGAARQMTLHAVRRVSTPVAHVHPPRAPTAASVTAAAAIDAGRPYPASPRPHQVPSPAQRAAPPTPVMRTGPHRGQGTPVATMAPDAAATAAEDEGEQMCVRALEEAQARIVAEREEIGRIEALLHEINKTRASDGPDADAFEEEDVREVEAEIAARQDVLKAMEADLEARLVKYETEVSVVANAIRKRASVLKAAEQRTRVLSENPRLMTFFAHKQNDLIEIRKSLYTALAEGRTPPV
ncbi:SMC N incomplete domain containing protein [Pandoravirus macleodensis]|uniref:SMC N incomplete domain containing protein n=1 Tax=Pandoravirus macleodensis TaxID=2107707 RepID=A0A2U7UF76_9VIRU|nr:SMC N incomplete domain containing protein [Pandoravirus macleodensis]AVK77015.1 SMC N incomplete domain containing protein [Pandoravirus macleodensis]